VNGDVAQTKMFVWYLKHWTIFLKNSFAKKDKRNKEIV